MNRRETTLSVVLGHAVADALGVPVEFESREDLKHDPVVDMRGFGSHPVPAGTWSDDTSMAIAALDSLANGVDYEDMMSKFFSWANENEYSAIGELFDIGISTRVALLRYSIKIPALKCGGYGENDNGNGSLMRIYPVALYWYYLPESERTGLDLVDLVFNVSALTHAHLRSMLACAIFSYVLLQLLNDPSKGAVKRGLRYDSIAIPGFRNANNSSASLHVDCLIDLNR